MMFRLTVIAVACAVLAYVPPAAAQSDEEDFRPRLFVGRYIQLSPMMIPFQTPRGIRYEVITVRLVIGENSTARQACWIAPKVHEDIMFYLWGRRLTMADFQENRRADLAYDILQYIESTTDTRYYESVELAGGYDEIDPESQNLSDLCR